MMSSLIFERATVPERTSIVFKQSCTQTLADMGAEENKHEPAEVEWPHISSYLAQFAGSGALSIALNCKKRLMLNLKSPNGMEAMRTCGHPTQGCCLEKAPSVPFVPRTDAPVWPTVHRRKHADEMLAEIGLSPNASARRMAA